MCPVQKCGFVRGHDGPHSFDAGPPVTAPPPESLERRVREWEERLGSRIGSGEALGPLVLDLLRAEVSLERARCLAWCAAFSRDDGTAQKIAAAIREGR